jgi:hypothetical protein
MISETYREIEIVLLETDNKWRFTANGRERTAPSLPKAREFIDNALDAVAAEKEKPFEKIPVIYMNPYPDCGDVGRIDKGVITSIAESNYRNEPVVWANTTRGKEKKDLSYFCADTPANNAVIEKLKEIAAQVETLKEAFRDEAKKIERVTLPKTI